MNKDFDHRKWLSFVQKAAALPMDFSESDFVWLLRVADEQYPALVPLVAACLSLTRGGVPTESTKLLPNTSTQVDNERMSRIKTIQGLLENRTLFPSNSHLVTFVKKRLPNLPDRRFDKMSRERIARSLAESISHAPSSVASVIMTELRKVDAAVSNDKGSFITEWENTIKAS